jgi:hypothetical protein
MPGAQRQNCPVIVPHRLDDLHAGVELDRGRDRTVAEKATDDFVPAGCLLEVNVAGQMPELMGRDPDADVPLDEVPDLGAEQA